MRRQMIIKEIEKLGYINIEDNALPLLNHFGVFTYVTLFKKSKNESFESYIALVYLRMTDCEWKEIDYSYSIISIPPNNLLSMEIKQKINEEIENINKKIDEEIKNINKKIEEGLK